MIINITNIPQFENLILENPVVLAEFYASWCPHCQAFAPKLEKAASELSIPVARLEIDDQAILTGYYEVQSIPTLILFADGKQVARHIGGMEPNQVIDFVKNNTPAGL